MAGSNSLKNSWATPFLAQPGDLDRTDGDHDTHFASLSQTSDQRLRTSTTQQQTQPPPMHPTNSMTEAPQLQQQQPYHPTNEKTTSNISQSNQEDDINKNGNDDSDDDEFLNDDDFGEDDDPTLQAFRERRLLELKQQHQQEQIQIQQRKSGLGEVRTLSQDEFLPACTGPSNTTQIKKYYAVVHFFQDEFERCRIMNHHLKRIAAHHSSTQCQFFQIPADKAPFFVTKLSIRTLPTVMVFRNGKTVDRLIGFEGLGSDDETITTRTANPDEFPTRYLGHWLERTGAIEYQGVDSDDDNNDDDEEEEDYANGYRGNMGIRLSRFGNCDDED